MEITEVRIKLMEDNSGSNERLQAFCSITFDDMFVIRDLKIIEGAKGFFVAMPSRKLTDRCHNCGTKNHLRSRFCNQCGCRLDENRVSATRTAGPSCTPTSPTPSTRCAARRSSRPCWPLTLKSSNEPRCQGTSRGTTSTKSTTSRSRTTATPRRRMPQPASPRSVAARCEVIPSTHAATSRCCVDRTFRPGAMARNRKSPRITIDAANPRRSAMVSEPAVKPEVVTVTD